MLPTRGLSTAALMSRCGINSWLRRPPTSMAQPQADRADGARSKHYQCVLLRGLVLPLIESSLGDAFVVR